MSLFLALLVACSTPLPDGVVVDAQTAPVPFTPEQIAAYNTVGRTWVFRVDSPQTPSMRRTMRFDEMGEGGAWVQSTVGAWDADSGPDGTPLVDSTRTFSTWSELQHHAAYPADATERAWAKARLPGGTVDCVQYTVDEGDGRVSTACFDPERPGPPVVMSQRDGETTQFTMTLQSTSVDSP